MASPRMRKRHGWVLWLEGARTACAMAHANWSPVGGMVSGVVIVA
jgi:hypothetical protein